MAKSIYIIIVSILLLTGCASTGNFLNARQAKGCYNVVGKVAAGAGGVTMLDAAGIMLTGGMTVDECNELRNAGKSGFIH